MIALYGRLIKSFGTEYSAVRQRTCLGSRGPQVQILLFRPLDCGNSSVGRASAFQAECREFEPRFPLQLFTRHQLSWQSTRLLIVLSQVQILYDAPSFIYAGMAELADALDLGSSVPDVRVQVSLFAPYMYMILHKNGVFFFLF